MKATFATALLAATAFAAPIVERASTPAIDIVVLQYALTLEHLEDTFYRQYLAQFSAADFTAAGFDSSVRDRIAMISSDETTHVSFLSGALTALGQTPTAACEYAFGVTDVKSFLATASVLEGVGVSAYLGAAASIVEKAYLTAAGAILTVESRHSSYIRNTIGESPFPAPFDTPLDFDQVYSLAAQFITSCPKTNPTLPVKAFTPLTAAPVGGTAKAGGYVKLTPKDKSVLKKQPLYAVWIGLTGNAVGAYNVETMQVMIPEAGFSGQTYVVLSTDKTASDDSVVAGPAILEL